jgi:hypothetical protein
VNSRQRIPRFMVFSDVRYDALVPAAAPAARDFQMNGAQHLDRVAEAVRQLWRLGGQRFTEVTFTAIGSARTANSVCWMSSVVYRPGGSGGAFPSTQTGPGPESELQAP